VDLDGSSFGYALELPWRDNQHEISCIPAGIYDIKLLPSPHFHNQLIPHLMDVPHRDNIMIHIANYPKEIKGCLAIGKTVAGPDFIGNSKVAFAELMEKIDEAMKANEEMKIEIKEG
jgi:hypothetical protein